MLQPALHLLSNEGLQEGIQIGRQQEARKLEKIIHNMLASNATIDVISSMTSLFLEEIKDIIDKNIKIEQ